MSNLDPADMQELALAGGAVLQEFGVPKHLWNRWLELSMEIDRFAKEKMDEWDLAGITVARRAKMYECLFTFILKNITIMNRICLRETP